MTGTDEISIRPARFRDVDAICTLVNRLAQGDEMLPRTPESVMATLSDFVVAETAGEFLGCSALKVWSKDLGEVRSLAVVESARRLGVGRKLVDHVAAVATERGLARLFAFTLQPGFFTKLGFEVVGHEQLPQKVFTDCMACPKFEKCDEIAMVRVLHSGHYLPDLELAEHIKARLPRRRVPTHPTSASTEPDRKIG